MVDRPVLTPFTGIAEILKGTTSLPKPKPAKRKKKETKSVLPSLIPIAEQPDEKREEGAGAQPDDEPRPPPTKRSKRAKDLDLKERDDEDRKNIALLTAYGKNALLGPYLASDHGMKFDPPKLRKLSKEKLKEQIEDVETILSNKSTAAISDGAVRYSMYMLESIMEQRAELLVKGTTDKCFEDEHWKFLLERAKMKYGLGFGKIDPVAELSLVTFQTGYMMHMSRDLQTPKIDMNAPYESNFFSSERVSETKR